MHISEVGAVYITNVIHLSEPRGQRMEFALAILFGADFISA